MTPELEFSIKYGIYPLVIALFTLFMLMYKKDMNNLKDSISHEEKDRRENREGYEDRLKSYENKFEKIYSLLSEMNTSIASIKQQLKNQEKICTLRHTWDGQERRKPK